MTEDEEWESSVREDLFPKVERSKIVLSLAPTAGKPDVKFCVELGAAISYDKPILVVHTKGSPPIPKKLRQIADEIIEDFDFESESSKAELARKLEVMAVKTEA